MFLRRISPLLLSLSACTRLGNLGEGVRGTLAEDARALPEGDPAGPGPAQVAARGTVVGDWDDGFPVSVYYPAAMIGPRPAVVFLPGRSVPEDQYESYGRALASRGFVVAVRGWYSFFRTDPELASDARKIAEWLVAKKLGDPARIGVAGHSMGGKTAIMAALAGPRFSAVVAIDPDENGRAHVARGPIAGLQAPLLVIGAEDAIKAVSLCATPWGNYRTFFDRAPPGTVELTLRRADHVQMLDAPEFPGMGICRVGTADSRSVRVIARGATVQFFEQHLLGIARGPLPTRAGASRRVKPPAAAQATR